MSFTIKRLIRFEFFVKRLSMGSFSKHSDWNWLIETRACCATFSTTPNPSSRSTHTQRFFPSELLSLIIEVRPNEGYVLSRYFGSIFGSTFKSVFVKSQKSKETKKKKKDSRRRNFFITNNRSIISQILFPFVSSFNKACLAVLIKSNTFKTKSKNF